MTFLNDVQIYKGISKPTSQTRTCTPKNLGTRSQRVLYGELIKRWLKFEKSYWIPRLRRLTKRFIRKCFGSKRLPTTYFPNYRQGNFKVVEVNYVDPIRFLKRRQQEGKAYIIMHACFLTRAMYLEVTKTVRTEDSFNIQTILQEERCPFKV